MIEDDRSVLDLHLDGEEVQIPKVGKLLGIWQQMNNTPPPNTVIKGNPEKIQQIRSRYNSVKQGVKPTANSSVKANLVILDN